MKTKLEEIDLLLKEIINISQQQVRKIAEIKALAYKYRIEVLDVGLICEECGGEVIHDKERVCSQCGLVAGPLLVSATEDPYQNQMESKWQKDNRIKNLRKRVNPYASVSLRIPAYKKLNKLASIEKVAVWRYLSELLTEEMCGEFPTFTEIPYPKTGKMKRSNVTKAVRDEFKKFCFNLETDMSKAVTQIVLKKYAEVNKK